MKINDLTGQTFGQLTVIDIATKDKNNQVIWSCRCECGTVTNKRRTDLKSGRSKSCGCARRKK